MKAQVENDDIILLQPQEQEDTYISDHVVVYPSESSGSRDVNCDCWVEPDDTYTLFSNTNMDDGSTGNLELPFTFELFGTDYTSFWLNINGHITFDQLPSGFFVDEDFPLNRTMIAPCHADVDLTCGTCGSIFYKVTEDAVYINWVDVGHFNATSDQVQNFQMIFTSNTSTLLGDGNNVQFCYRDMQWTETNSSNTIEIGASAGNGTDFIQFGVFENENNSDYDGPFGNNDGVDWLDNKTISFNSSLSSAENTPPISVGASECDTIRLCIDDTQTLEFAFLAPEDNQTIDILIDDGGFSNLTSTIVTDNYTIADLLLSSDGVAPGFYNLTVTATDDGVPAESTTASIIVEVIAEAIPDLDIYFEDEIVSTVSFCAGQSEPILSGTDGFDCYTWTNGLTEQSGTFGQGTYSLEAFFMGCEANAGPVSVFQIPVFNPNVSVEEASLCEGETTTVTFDDADLFPEFTWDIPTSDGEIVSQDDENFTIEVTSGLYTVSVVDENGCTGTTSIPVIEEIINLPQAQFPQIQCDDNEIVFTGAWADPNECPMVIFMNDSDGDTWEGGFIEAFVDGAGPFVFSISNAFQFIATGQDMFHGQTIEFFWNPGIDDDDIRVRFFEPGNNTNEIFDTDDGDVLIDGDEPFFTYTADCGYNALPGVWTIDPDIGELSHPGVHNPVDANQTYTAPEDYIGTVNLMFESDICDLVYDFDVTFGTIPVASVTSDSVCGDEQATLELTIEPAGLIGTDLTIDWSPNGSPNADGELTANFNNTANVTVTVENFCGESEAQGFAEILPIPNPQLSATTICEGTSLNLNPIATEHPSYEYVWTTGSNDESISVTDAGTYSVTVSNDCGTESASVDLSVTPIPSVQFWASDTLICAGSEVNVNPVWSGVPAEGPVTWSISYTNDQEEFITDTYDSNGLQFTIGSGMVPSDAPLGAIYTYSYANACGLAQGSVAAYTDLCFVNAYNVITPDSDGSDGGTFANGLNEGWQIVGIDGVSGVEVQIFDRWGGLVYESSNYSNLTPWRGDNLNGDPLEDGVYFYTAFIPRGERELTGTVTILRTE